ncbi:mediator of RNA polymerase II transcription subunit 22 isoform X1 [Melanotaenia boesemani]|uniref:mediator of RNA polymerase II transcription subunit 22 isoform X1 n=1 Tax=Melanotaenia boesemani TaxID=1250792 RepID=UPI001C05BF31|nr:mediator of RNA polymerase II transcription subunit 22 isoform X1 [Melanotaenia boesemani]
MAAQRALPQSKETLLQNYNKRLKDDIKSIMDNFTEMIKTAKIEDETQVSRAAQAEQDHYEMHVRAANIVRAGESLMKLVSDLKQFLILNDFPSVNDAISLQNQQLRALQEECDKKLTSLRDEIAVDLYELEEEYYSSRFLLRKATVSGTALTCLCVRPTDNAKAGPLQTAAAVLTKMTERTQRDRPHRRQPPNTTPMDMGLAP